MFVLRELPAQYYLPLRDFGRTKVEMKVLPDAAVRVPAPRM